MAPRTGTDASSSTSAASASVTSDEQMIAMADDDQLQEQTAKGVLVGLTPNDVVPRTGTGVQSTSSPATLALSTTTSDELTDEQLIAFASGDHSQGQAAKGMLVMVLWIKFTQYQLSYTVVRKDMFTESELYLRLLF